MLVTLRMKGAAGSCSVAEYTAHSSGPTAGSHGAVYQLYRTPRAAPVNGSVTEFHVHDEAVTAVCPCTSVSVFH